MEIPLTMPSANPAEDVIGLVQFITEKRTYANGHYRLLLVQLPHGTAEVPLFNAEPFAEKLVPGQAYKLKMYKLYKQSARLTDFAPLGQYGIKTSMTPSPMPMPGWGQPFPFQHLVPIHEMQNVGHQRISIFGIAVGIERSYHGTTLMSNVSLMTRNHVCLLRVFGDALPLLDRVVVVLKGQLHEDANGVQIRSDKDTFIGTMPLTTPELMRINEEVHDNLQKLAEGQVIPLKRIWAVREPVRSIDELLDDQMPTASLVRIPPGVASILHLECKTVCATPKNLERTPCNAAVQEVGQDDEGHRRYGHCDDGSHQSETCMNRARAILQVGTRTPPGTVDVKLEPEQMEVLIPTIGLPGSKMSIEELKTRVDAILQEQQVYLYIHAQSCYDIKAAVIARSDQEFRALAGEERSEHTITSEQEPPTSTSRRGKREAVEPASGTSTSTKRSRK